MHGTRAIRFAWLIVAGFSAGCSGKRSEPAPSQEAPRASAPYDGGGPVDASAIDAPPSAGRRGEALAQPDPLAARFAERFTPNKTLPAGMQRRIRFHLRATSKAPIALDPIIDIPRDDGGHEVFAIYAYSVYENCVLGYPTRKEGRERCTNEWGDSKRLEHVSMGPGAGAGWEELIRVNGACVSFGAVRASFAPPDPAATGDTGGAVTVSSIAFPNTLCTMDTYSHVFVADVDNDKKLEMYIDLTTAHVDTVSARQQPDQSVQRDLFIWDGGSSADVALSSGLINSAGFPGGKLDISSQELFDLRDLDHDGHLDLIQFELLPPGADPPEKREVAHVYLYDRKSDTWRATNAPLPEPEGVDAAPP